MIHLNRTMPIYKLSEIQANKRFQRLFTRLYFMTAAVFIACLCVVNICMAEPVRHVIGKAYNNNKTLIYTENYAISELETLVIYKNSTGKMLAAKSIRYHANKPYRPDITIFKHSNNSTLALTDKNNVLKLTQSDHFNNSEVVRENTIDNSLVTDAAFNRYIQDNWQAIQDNDKSTVNFTTAQHARIVSVNLVVSSDASCNKLGWQCLSIRPSNWFLRLLIDEVIVGYDQHMALRYFNGPATSIIGSSNQQVSIHYHEYTPVQDSHREIETAAYMSHYSN